MHITLKHKTPNIKQMYYILVILAVFSAACAQMLLKQGARQEYAHWWRQYLNIWVISGYFILFGSMVLNVFAMSNGVQIKELSIIEALGYIFIPALSFLIFKEKLTWRKIFAIAIIITGVIVFFV